MPTACVIAGNAGAVTTASRLPWISAFKGGGVGQTGNDH
jgi:hypothetical protein